MLNRLNGGPHPASQRPAPANLEQTFIALAQDVAAIRADLGLMKWMHGITIGGMLALLIKTSFD